MSGSVLVRQLDIGIDGDSVCCYVAGSPKAPVIVSHHGTPVTGLYQTAAFLLANVSDVCHVAFDRPGYGGSTRMEGRSVGDVVRIMGALLDELGVARASVYGHSGGGPHALATAALLPERISRAAVLAGMAPAGEPDLDYFDKQSPLMRNEMLAALAGPQQSRDFFRRLDQESSDNPFESVLTDGDSRLAEETRLRTESLRDALDAREASTRLEDGYVDDFQAFVTPWGFELGAIGVPVRLLQGTDDLMVPPAHSEWLRDHIPGASLQLLPGYGHLLQQVHARVYRWLASNDGDRNDNHHLTP